MRFRGGGDRRGIWGGLKILTNNGANRNSKGIRDTEKLVSAFYSQEFLLYRKNMLISIPNIFEELGLSKIMKKNVLLC